MNQTRKNWYISWAKIIVFALIWSAITTAGAVGIAFLLIKKTFIGNLPEPFNFLVPLFTGIAWLGLMMYIAEKLKIEKPNSPENKKHHEFRPGVSFTDAILSGNPFLDELPVNESLEKLDSEATKPAPSWFKRVLRQMFS